MFSLYRWKLLYFFINQFDIPISLLGITVPTRENSDHHVHIRVFPIFRNDRNKPKCRSNENYDKVMVLKNPNWNKRKGYLGKCALRSLKHFDVGKSFLSDTLHNIYGGTMVSIL